MVLTKLDGDTRGGAEISIRSVVSKPLKFISSGEKMDALQAVSYTHLDVYKRQHHGCIEPVVRTRVQEHHPPAALHGHDGFAGCDVGADGANSV